MKKISMKKIMNSTKVSEMKTGYTPEWALVLEPVRKLATNVGSRIRRCIYEALEKDPPEWAKKRLEVSISKEVYKGNAAGPTKRAVVSVLTDLEEKNFQEKLKKMKEEKKNKKRKMVKEIDEECIVGSVDDLVMKKKVDEECSVVDSGDDLVMKRKIEEEGIVDNGGDVVMRKKIEEEGIVDNGDDLVMKKKIEEEGIVDSVDDLVMKKCRIVLRTVGEEDKDGIFFDFLKGNGKDDGCFVGNPVMGSCSLDFRSIDLRLADGSYCGSHEAFYDDVQEVWNNICLSFNEQVDLELAERLERSFEEMYDREVLAVVQKPAERASSVAIKERDESLARVSESLIPKVQREEGFCKVCGMDEDDDNVLLCDGCDSEYHRYCLNPPLVKIPKGDWYCPSCVSGQCLSRSTLSISGVDSQCNLEKGQRLNQLGNAMTIKESEELDRGEGTICLQCGDVGFDNAYVYCCKCLKFVVHRYCLPEMPKTFDEFVYWVCDHCGAAS